MNVPNRGGQSLKQLYEERKFMEEARDKERRLLQREKEKRQRMEEQQRWRRQEDAR